MKKPASQSSINLKLSEDLKGRAKNRADIKQQTISKFIRELLTQYLDGTLCKDDVVKNEKKAFINSSEFLRLIVWMYSIRKSNVFKESQIDLNAYKDTLKKVTQHLPNDLVLEFDKVLFDLMRVTNEKLEYSKRYEFAKSYGSSQEFDFELLERYLLNYDKLIAVLSVNLE